jgi:hypothetical protein
VIRAQAGYHVFFCPSFPLFAREYIVLDDDAGFVVRKNGRDAGHGVIRARMHEIEKDGCRYHSCPNGARTAYWTGVTRGGKYNGSGDLRLVAHPPTS